jgi:hypothetical protein
LANLLSWEPTLFERGANEGTGLSVPGGENEALDTPLRIDGFDILLGNHCLWSLVYLEGTGTT